MYWLTWVAKTPVTFTHTFDNTAHHLSLPRPPFFACIAILLLVHFQIPLFVHMFTPCAQVFLRLWQPFKTTRYGPCMVVPLRGQFTSFNVLWKLVTCFSRHNTTDTIDNTTQVGRKRAAVQWWVFLRTARSDPQHSEELWWKIWFSGAKAPWVVPINSSTHLNSITC
jgi:hypothetical protein